MRPRGVSASEQASLVLKALKRIPTIGDVTAQKLINRFGEGFLASKRTCRFLPLPSPKASMTKVSITTRPKLWHRMLVTKAHLSALMPVNKSASYQPSGLWA